MGSDDHLGSGVGQTREIVRGDRGKPLILKPLDLFGIVNDMP